MSFLRLVVFLSFSFFGFLEARAGGGDGAQDVCDQVKLTAVERAHFDLEACKREQVKKLNQIDYKTIYQADTKKEWHNPSLKFSDFDFCEDSLVWLYNDKKKDKCDNHLSGDAPVLLELGRLGKWSKAEKKLYCQHLIKAECLILREIETLEKSFGDSGYDSDGQIRKWINLSLNDEKPNQWPSDIALSVSVLLKKNKSFSESLRWLFLAMRSVRPVLDSDLLSLSTGFIDDYNELINAGVKRPSSEAFLLVNGASIILAQKSMAQDSLKVFKEHIASELSGVRDLMVRWPISPSKLVLDTYYPDFSLVKRVYSKGFVSALMKNVYQFKGVFSAKTYQGQKNPGKDEPHPLDLADQLYSQGFFGAKGHYDKNVQHLWVSPHDFMVRVKYAESILSWQFTVGIAFLNPFGWSFSLDNKATAQDYVESWNILKRYNYVQSSRYLNEFQAIASQYSPKLMNFQYNEVFKVTLQSGGLVTLMPAFLKFYWSDDLTLNEIGDYLDSAHYTLKHAGDKSGSLSLLEKRYF